MHGQRKLVRINLGHTVRKVAASKRTETFQRKRCRGKTVNTGEVLGDVSICWYIITVY